jgi:hypothetical protein
MELTPRARHFLGITLGALAAFVAVAIVTASTSDWPFSDTARPRAVQNLSGPLGSAMAWASIDLLGRVFAWVVPFALLGLTACTFAAGFPSLRRWVWKAAASVVLLNAFFALTPLARHTTVLRGRLGNELAGLLEAVFGETGGTIVVVTAFLLIALGELSRLGGLAVNVSARLASVRSVFVGAPL